MKKIIPKIVTIGGGEIREFETLKIDREIIKLTGKKNPKALFIPTASNDAPLYWQSFNNLYGKRLKCKTDVLFLIDTNISSEDIKHKILNADLIYVGGGNTKEMLKIWHRLGVDEYLMMAMKKGIVLSGLSAGSICWYKYGQSDSLQFTTDSKTKLIKLKALGFINAIHVPHYHSEQYRHKHFEEMILKSNLAGIAIDDNCAIVFIGDNFKIVSSVKNRHAYLIRKDGNKINKQIIKPSNFNYLTKNLL